MQTFTKNIIENLRSKDRGVQNQAFHEMLSLTDEKVD